MNKIRTLWNENLVFQLGLSFTTPRFRTNFLRILPCWTSFINMFKFYSGFQVFWWDLPLDLIHVFEHLKKFLTIFLCMQMYYEIPRLLGFFIVEFCDQKLTKKKVMLLSNDDNDQTFFSKVGQIDFENIYYRQYFSNRLTKTLSKASILLRRFYSIPEE